jgi:hypothetical protein
MGGVMSMDVMPWQAVVFISIPEAFLVNLMGLALVGIKPDLKKLLVMAVLQAICSYFIRALPLVYGVHMVLQLLTTFILIKLILGYGWGITLPAVLLGFVIFTGILDPLYIPFITKKVPLDMILANPWLRVAVSFPQQLAMLAIVLVCRRYDFRLINIPTNNE